MLLISRKTGAYFLGSIFAVRTALLGARAAPIPTSAEDLHSGMVKITHFERASPANWNGVASRVIKLNIRSTYPATFARSFDGVI